MGRECYYTMKWLSENKHKCITPFIVFHSKTDMITNIENTKTFVDGCSVKNKTFIELEDGNHTLLVPLNKDDMQPYNIMVKIIDWIFNINNK